MPDQGLDERTDRRGGNDRRRKERRQRLEPIAHERRTGDHRRNQERRIPVAEILITPIMIRRP